MKIFIQGRKRGYSVLYPFPTPDEFYFFAKDIQSINAQNQAQYYGKSLYSIAFSRGGRIFSKYVLGYDVQRSNLGNVSFSIFIPDAKTMSGGNVIDVLDELASTYFKTYAPNYYIPECQENWSLFTEIASRYDTKLMTIDNLDIQHMESGRQDAAFVYYSSREKLANLFENVYQSAYSQYRQIFLIDDAYANNTDNPLTAFQHTQNANLTSSIDPENKRYRLVLKSDVPAKVFSNGDTRPLPNNDHFYKNDKLRIEWEKKYYKKISIEGDEVKQYLDIDEIRRIVSVKPRKLDKETKDIQAQFLLKGSPVTDLTVQYRNNQGVSKLMENGVLHFEGEEIYQDWTLSISDKHFISQEESIRPEFEKKLLVITLKEKKKITVRVIDENNNSTIESAKIYCRGNNQGQTWMGKSNIFYDEQLDEEYVLEVTAPGYVRNVNCSFTPRELEDDEIRIELEKEQREENFTAPMTYDRMYNNYDEHRSRHVDGGVEFSHVERRRELVPEWLLRNWLYIVLGVLLLCSLILNLALLIQNSTIEEQCAEISNAKEYIQKGDLLSSQLSNFDFCKKLDPNLYDNLNKLGACRNDIDKGYLNTDHWDPICLNNSEIRRLKNICEENLCLKNKMERRLQDLDNIANKPLKEIVDSLAELAANFDKYDPLVENDPVKPEESGGMVSGGSQSPTAINIPSGETEKKSKISKLFSKLLSRIFSKRN